MTDPRVEAAIDAVIKARGWRDSRWGDGAIGGFDYSTEEKKRHVIRDHEAEAREGKTVILFETDDYEEYEREYRRACIRREISVTLAAANAAAWSPARTPPDAGILVLIASSAETGSEQAIALWDYDIGCWRNPETGMRYAPAYFSHWQPLPTPPNATPQATHNTITIPEVRNDRPIEIKNMLT
ncbi:hypothetical protein [Acetobacter okinawensis]|uniref:hypothetical protein n=1 Tax=Acetobacter okinawensis TaxID=1076594 RepID=UPI0039E83615